MIGARRTLRATAASPGRSSGPPAMPITQSHRFCSFDSPLGPDALLLRGMVAEEAVSAPFHAVLQLESENHAIDPHDLVGKPGSVAITMADGSQRHLHGIVASFHQGGRSTRVSYYRVELRPWLWLLTRRADCRIFQEMTVPDIVAKVFQGAGFSDFRKDLQGTYPSRTFCVQYRETDFAFVSRLLEEEGICYYWVHTAEKHELVLTDTTTDLRDCPGGQRIVYRPLETGQVGDDTIHGFERTQELHPGKYSLKDFNFEDPANTLAVSAPTTDGIGGNGNLELYDFHVGDYGTSGDGNRLVRMRIQAQETASVRFHGRSDVRALTAGHRFELAEHPHGDWNGKKFLVTRVRHELHQASAFHSDDVTGSDPYRNEFECAQTGAPFRPAAVTPKPLIRGPQTAIVVGPSGEEIHVDKYGRIKVQFHWDRLGKKDAHSSCWIRVSRSWASKAWGQVAHPRIGDEVIVEFLEGDPDQPIVTGCVYNAAAMPPYDLPANKTQAGLKSRSSPNGAAANFNEIRFEDKKGNEELHIQAEKNKTVVVKNDRTESVGHDETVTIGNDQTLSVGKNRTRSVGEHETVTVGKDQMLTVTDHQTITVGKNQEVTVGEDREQSVGKNESLNVGGNQVESIGGTLSLAVAKDATQDLSEKWTVSVGKDAAITVGGKCSWAVAKETAIAAKKVQITADDEITLTTGEASIVMKKNGDITIQGKKITVKGSGDVVLKGSKITQN